MGSSISTTKHTQDYNSLTPEDVFAVRNSLLAFVPMELVNLILDEAKYWPKATCSFRSKNALKVIDDTVCCLLTTKLRDLLRSGVDGAVKVKAVCFKILSHDQGWCDENDFSQPYEGSYTWFEALTIPDSYMYTPRQSRATLNSGFVTYVAPVNRGDDIKDPGCEVVTFKIPNDENSDMWVVQRNKRASRGFQLHTVVWTEEEEEADDESILMNETGRGMGRGFVKSLKMDDRIAVMARAQYAGWINYARSIELEIYYSV